MIAIDKCFDGDYGGQRQEAYSDKADTVHTVLMINSNAWLGIRRRRCCSESNKPQAALLSRVSLVALIGHSENQE